jgi:3-oxoacyl-[acyl-carrier protein] reductase
MRCRGLYGSAVDEYGRIDVAVNNAGLGGTTNIVEMSDEQWSRCSMSP